MVKAKEFRLQRIACKERYRYGVLSDLASINEPIGFTVENGTLQKAVPPGRYRLILRKAKTPLTLKYAKYPWFTWHIELSDVPNATGVYVHIGNSSRDTDACILLGATCDMRPSDLDGCVSRSTETFESWYCSTRDALEKGQEVYLTIIDPKA